VLHARLWVKKHYRVARAIQAILQRLQRTTGCDSGFWALMSYRKKINYSSDAPKRFRNFLPSLFFYRDLCDAIPGVHVSRAHAVEGFENLFRANVNTFPKSQFYMVGSLEEVEKKRNRLQDSNGIAHCKSASA